MDFAELHEKYSSNITPAMAEMLAAQLGVTAESLVLLGLGWWPLENVWTFPERDTDGEIIGMIRRTMDHHKVCIKESKRGLTYSSTGVQDGYNASRQSWLRVDESYPCPICGGVKWCGVDGNVTPPRFVRCMKVAEDAVHTCAAGGHIHELIAGSFRPAAKHQTALASSDLPVLVVEGQTDTAAGMDLGFVTVGKPSAQGGLKLLIPLLRGRHVVVLGEHDAGAGREGMEKTFDALSPTCASVVKLMPPAEYKDLRDWKVRGGLCQDALLAAIAGVDQGTDPNMLDSIDYMALARLWVEKKHTEGTEILLRQNGRDFHRWDGTVYRDMSIQQIEGDLYAFMEPKIYAGFAKGAPAVLPYGVDIHKVTNILRPLSALCLAEKPAPCWLDGRVSPRIEDLVVFSNGVLDVPTYLKGDVRLLPPTPRLYVHSTTPYAFDAKAQCPQWLRFLGEIFEGDAERVAQLQEWMGLNMVPDISFEKFMVFIGVPASGKSTVIEVMKHVVGPAQCSSVSLTSLCGDFGLQPLVGKLSVFMPDAHMPKSKDGMLALEALKTIVGGDAVDVNRKFKEVLSSHRMLCRITMAMNEVPQLHDDAGALKRRLCLLHFPASFVGREDRTLKGRLITEAPGIAVWALEGLRRLRKTGRFTEPEACLLKEHEFTTATSPMADFLSECCYVGHPGAWTPSNQLYDVWSGWTRETGARFGGGSVHFGRKLLGAAVGVKKCRHSDSGRQVWGYSGIELKPEAKDQYLGGGR